MIKKTIMIGVILSILPGCGTLPPGTPERSPLPQNPAHTVEPWSKVPTATPKPTPIITPSPKKVIFVHASNIPSRYHLGRVISGWNKAKYIRLVTTNKSCRPGWACITITMANLSDGKGFTTSGESQFGNYPYLTTIKFDGSDTDPQGTACHEIGHTLGLGHITKTKKSSCMKTMVIDLPNTPTNFDICWLNHHGRWDFDKAYTTNLQDVDGDRIAC